jgi:hypothetical protein
MKFILFALACLIAAPAFAQPQTVHPAGKWKKSQNLPKVSYGESQAGDPSEYREFGREVSGIVSKMKEVATGREKDDLRVLEFRLREYNQAVSNRDWSKADSIRSSLGVQLNRGDAVAADAGRRKAAAERAEADRRHQEAMRQRERQHQEAMARQRSIEDQLRMQNGLPRSTRNRYPGYGF